MPELATLGLLGLALIVLVVIRHWRRTEADRTRNAAAQERARAVAIKPNEAR